MILIAHRGNVNGPNEKLENSVEYINTAIKLGFNVEVDIWWYNNCYYLGHDFPQWKITDKKLLSNKNIWFHAKNLEALEKLINIKNCNVFWHQNDDFTLTSAGFIWTYPGNLLCNKSVCVTNELLLTKEEFKVLSNKCYAICSDYVNLLKNY